MQVTQDEQSENHSNSSVAPVTHALCSTDPAELWSLALIELPYRCVTFVDAISTEDPLLA
ncbi:MAG: hypothetical protein CL912_34185 [Deltaproteobacteria bacterium]|nr:hypothetical protein [Deltaproteobacteria bacterium]